jgi:hypothetical protein
MLGGSRWIWDFGLTYGVEGIPSPVPASAIDVQNSVKSDNLKMRHIVVFISWN